MKIGNMFSTNSCGKIEVIDEIENQVIKVRFVETGSVINTRKNAVRIGAVRDPMKRTVFGVGYLGDGGIGAKKDRKAYRRWHAMMSRCYNERSDRYRFYGAKGIRVSKDWHNFQNYMKWFQENFKDGLQIDKDLLGGDSPVYGPNTCVCITPRLNQFGRSPMRMGKSSEVISVGSDKFCVTVRCPEGYSKYIGLFDDPNEALIVYSDVKHSYFSDLLEQDWQSGMISRFTYKKLKFVTPALFYEKAQIQ